MSRRLRQCPHGSDQRRLLRGPHAGIDREAAPSAASIRPNRHRRECIAASSKGRIAEPRSAERAQLVREQRWLDVVDGGAMG